MCEYKQDGMRCTQPIEAWNLCSYHLRLAWISVEFKIPMLELIDRYYNEKIMTGLISPTWYTLSEAEIMATMWGRYRGDGRRLDQYTILEDEHSR